MTAPFQDEAYNGVILAGHRGNSPTSAVSLLGGVRRPPESVNPGPLKMRRFHGPKPGPARVPKQRHPLAWPGHFQSRNLADLYPPANLAIPTRAMVVAAKK